MKEEGKMDLGRKLLSWRAPEFRKHERGSVWIFCASFCALLLLGFSIWQESYAPVIALLLIAGIYFLTHNKMPREIEIFITTNGISIDRNFLPFGNIEAFWIYFSPSENLSVLNLLLRSGVIRERVIELEETNPDEVRSALSGRVLEWEGRTESTVEKLIRLLKL